MRYAKATDDFYVPEADDVRTQVGKPGRTRSSRWSRSSPRPPVMSCGPSTRRPTQPTSGWWNRVARELARAVMPVGAYTEFYWTVNARSLMNFVSLRAAATAQREIRRYAEACERFLAEEMPVTYEELRRRRPHGPASARRRGFPRSGAAGRHPGRLPR